MSDGGARIDCDEFLPHPPSLVWRALTDPALQARWWAPGDVKPVVGHRFTLTLGAVGEMPCEVLEVEPERLLRYRLSGSSIDTILTWRLAPEGRGTRLLLTQEGFDLDSPLAKDVYDRMNHGWPLVLRRMEPVLREFAAEQQRP